MFFPCCCLKACFLQLLLIFVSFSSCDGLSAARVFPKGCTSDLVTPHVLRTSNSIIKNSISNGNRTEWSPIRNGKRTEWSPVRPVIIE